MGCNDLLGKEEEKKRRRTCCRHTEGSEAAALRECDSLTDSLPKIYCGAAERLVWLGVCVRAYVADAFKPFLRGTLDPLVLTAY